MKKLIANLLMASCLIISVSCGNDDDNDKNVVDLPQEEQIEDFSTRLDRSLLVAGFQCNGGETTEYGEATYTCDDGQWLITADNINQCDEAGRCTEVFVPAFVAELDSTDIVSIPESTFKVIRPISPILGPTQDVLNRVYVKTDLDGSSSAVFR